MNRLKILREEKNLFQSDLAKVLNVSVAAYSFYESGKRDMGTDTIKKLADFFKVSADYLLGISDVRNPEELKNVQFANHGGLNTEGLGEEELEELQRQIDFIKKMKNKKEK